MNSGGELIFTFCFRLLRIYFAVILFSSLLIFGFQLEAQTTIENSTLKWLSEQGFENIQIYEQNDSTFVLWENRIFRYEVHAISEVLKELPIPSTSVTVLLPKYSNIPMLSMVVSKEDLIKYRKGELEAAALLQSIKISQDVEPWRQIAKQKEIVNSSYRKVDFTIHPVLRYLLGNYNVPIRVKFSLAPTADIQLANGLNLKGQLVIPLTNNFDKENSITAGLITLTQNVRLDDNLFFTATAGYFSRRRLGMDVQMKQYLMDGKLGININAGYTVPSTISGDLALPFFEDDNYFTARFGFDYRVAIYDLVFKLDYGMFLYNEKGLRAEVARQFGEVNIGLFGTSTTTNADAGFYFSMPLWPKKYKSIRKVRLRPPRYFNLGYRFNGGIQRGVSYATGENSITKSKEFNPDFVRNELLKFL